MLFFLKENNKASFIPIVAVLFSRGLFQRVNF